jgi:hypothetical protein
LRIEHRRRYTPEKGRWQLKKTAPSSPAGEDGARPRSYTIYLNSSGKWFKNGDHFFPSVVNDFAQTVSRIVGFEVCLSDGPKVNETLSAEQMIALAEFRQMKLSNSEGQLHSASDALISLFHAINRSGIVTGTKPMLTAYARNQIVSRNSKYFQELVDLCPDLTTDPSWENWFYECNQFSFDNCGGSQSEAWGNGSHALYKLLAVYSPVMIEIYLLLAGSVPVSGKFNVDPLINMHNFQILDKIKGLNEYEYFCRELDLVSNAIHAKTIL